MGGHAELIVVPTDGAVVALPDAVGDAAAVALCDGGLTALPFLRDAGRVQAGERVLVIGASGSVGSHAVQLARWLGAHVTAVTSTSNLELVKNLGAHEAIDYRERDVTASSEQWDVVFDAVGATDWRHARRILAPSGRYLRTVPSWDIVLRTLLRSRRAVIAFTGLRPRDAVRPDLAELVRLAAEGVLEPLIDGSYPLSDAPAAYARVDSRRKRGTVVLAP
jgi:NADPH:quinone reductase-like Zn-dependent oxidoreductase